MKIAILGFGPSAMFSIMACNTNGITPVVYGEQPLRIPSGAFYYHWLPLYYARKVQSYLIAYFHKGTEDIYLQKQWGTSEYESSFGKYSQESGYSPVEVYEVFRANAAYEHVPVKNKFTTDDVFAKCNEYDIVICTFPLKEIYDRIKKVRRVVQVINYPRPTENRIMYSGDPADEWIRISELFGYTYVEYASAEGPSIYSGFMTQIIDLYPNQWYQEMIKPDNLHFMGRYAELNRRRLAHEAYAMTEEILNA